MKPPQTCNQHIFRPELNASRDFADKQPDFAVSAVMAALHWMARGYGYQIPAGDVLEAYSSVLNAASAANVAEAQIKTQIRDLITKNDSGNNIILATLRDRLIPCLSGCHTHLLGIVGYDTDADVLCTSYGSWVRQPDRHG